MPTSSLIGTQRLFHGQKLQGAAPWHVDILLSKKDNTLSSTSFSLSTIIMKTSIMKTRREFLAITGTSLFLVDAAMLFGANETNIKASWKVGIFDPSIRARGCLTAFPVAKKLGYEGVQVSYMLQSPDPLSVKANRPKYLAAAKETGMEIASFAMGFLNDSPLATTPEAEGWIEDCLDAMIEMNVDQVLVPFFGRADLTQNPEHIPLVIEKLKRLAPIAAGKKKFLALETFLSAEDHLKILDAVASDAVKVYYDVANSAGKGYDIFQEIEFLGNKKLISQIHFKENGFRLGNGGIDFPKVCETLARVGYKGWIVVEGSAPGDMMESQAANSLFVKKLIGRQ